MPSPVASLAGLHAAVMDLKEESSALRECLANEGVLGEERFLAQLHRRRFSEALQLHPCSWTLSLKEALSPRETSLPTALFAGVTALRFLGATSRSLSSTVGAIEDSVKKTLPKIYLFGGICNMRFSSSVECFDIARAAWEVLPPMSQQRDGAAAVVASGHIHVLGGRHARHSLSSAERFDPAARAWEALPSMLQRRYRAAAAVVSSQIFVCGGDDGQHSLSSTECLDLETRSWVPLPPMSQRRDGVVATVLAQSMYVCGGVCGRRPLSPPLNTVEVFDPSRKTWQPLPAMTQRRDGAVAAALAGLIYVCGGFNGQQSLCSAESFDPIRRTWEPLPSMTQQRMFAACVVVTGHMFVFGGLDKQHRLTSAEVFDPASGFWQALHPMPRGRSGAAAAAVLPK